MDGISVWQPPEIEIPLRLMPIEAIMKLIFRVPNLYCVFGNASVAHGFSYPYMSCRHSGRHMARVRVNSWSMSHETSYPWRLGERR